MPAVDDSPSERKHTSSSYRDELAHYKTQYEQLEAELADFQVSSRELEAELEKDIEASEKRERQLKEKVDTLRYEVDEWKVRCWSRMWLSSAGLISLSDQVQAVKVRSQLGAKQLAEGDHFAPRHESYLATEIARYRGCKRRL